MSPRFTGASPGLTVPRLLFVTLPLDRSYPCERATGIDKSVARGRTNRAINLQHATVDIGVAGVSVSSSQIQCARADLGQGAANAATLATVLDRTGKDRA